MSPGKSKIAAFFLGFCLSLSTGQVAAVEVSQSPLFVSNTAEPNILFILDDSVSMTLGFLPDELGSRISGEGSPCPGGIYAGVLTCYVPIVGNKAAVSPDTNQIYYDPDVTYAPPLMPDGTPFPPSDYLEAPVDGYDVEIVSADPLTDPLTLENRSEKVNLADNYRAIMDTRFRQETVCINGAFRLESNGNICPSGTPVDLVGYVIGDANPSGVSGIGGFYFKRKLDGIPDGVDCAATFPDDACFERVSIGAAEETNFANWFSYYRNRQLLSRAGITEAFFDQSENLRLGYGALNSSGTLIDGVQPFVGASKTDFFSWLQGAEVIEGADAIESTPLRKALQDAGDYFSRTPNTVGNNPWRTNPESGENPEYLECRQSFAVLMTDGDWNGSSLTDVGNSDGVSGVSINGPSGRSYQYGPSDPFQDGVPGTLADVAMAYWKNDLQPEIANRVPASARNPAFWQHMTTYGVGFGVIGLIDPDVAFDAIANPDGWAGWPDPTPSSKIDDLLHASVNSRGGFFSASDPTTFGDRLNETIGQITEAVGSASGITFDTATLEQDSLLFSARFDSRYWDGDLDARPLIFNPGDDEPTIGAPEWSAADKLDARDYTSRFIATYNGAAGVPFLWDSLTDTQKADLSFGEAPQSDAALALGTARLAFLRGKRFEEGGDFRVRGSRLGDIVHSTPVRVSDPASGWPDTDLFGELNNRYSDFRAANVGRTPVIYVGANDGMLHGFKATVDGGDELMAYVPGSVYSDTASQGLHQLTSTGYIHKYYVDLSPLVSDVFTKGRTADGTITSAQDWRTVLFGGLRAGGRGVFALDITDPTKFNETSAGQLALWEFTADPSDAVNPSQELIDSDALRKNLGQSIQPPQVALADWGNGDYRWTAFVANGYNAKDNDGNDIDSTGFFMIDIEGGIGSPWLVGDNFEYIQFSSAGGGLSPLTLYDSDGDRIVDRIYAGDTAGRMWVAEGDNTGWASSYRSSGIDSPLFTAPLVGDPAISQAITSAPIVIPNAGQKPAGNSPDTYVIFGTGKYLGLGDISDNRQQAVYAVRDLGAGGRTVDNLAQRSLREVQNFEGGDLDVLLSEADSASNATSDNLGWYVNLFEAGERVTLAPQVRGRYIFVTSIIPSANPCVAGGESRLMAFGLDGLTPDKAVFLSALGPVSAFKKIDGIANDPAFLGDFLFTPTSGGGEPDVEGVDVGNVSDNLGRQGWQELIED
ncbi:pilus assembly protein [Marinobacter changyiensis]|uniref:pilus assembly protein n=1 Tax=Marinobacter changyiensis TaxID=2604091 RepID=UPI0015D41298|nr:PilC/PilY family type IV pilus protein [Marinobacter changyiensis]